MSSYRALAWKELMAQRVTSILILIALVLSTLTTTVIGQSVGILNAMRRQQAVALNGDKYASFLQITEKQLQMLKMDDRLSYVGASIGIGTVELSSHLSLQLMEYAGDSLDVYPSIARLQEGRLPERAMEIALPQDALTYLGFHGKVGDTISLPVSKSLRHGILPSIDYTASFLLVGITESNYLAYSMGSVAGIAGAGTAEYLLPENYLYYKVDFRTADRRSFQDTVNDLTSQMQLHELDVSYNIVYLSAMGIPFDGENSESETGLGFALTAIAGITVGILILLAAGLVIYNVLKISVSQRITEYGILRAIGSEKGQLYAIVTAQLMILCLVGIPIGLAGGLLSAKGILIMATGLLSPEVFMVQNAPELQEMIAANSAVKIPLLLASAAVTLLFAFVAAIPAAAFAARVSPATAMSGHPARFKRRKRTGKNIKNFEMYYASLNLRRSRGRSAITVLSLVMSISVFVSLQSFTALLNTAAPLEGTHLGDYSVLNETSGFSSGVLEALSRNENVAGVAALQMSLYLPDAANRVTEINLGFTLQPGETFQVAGLSDLYWAYLMGGTLSAGDLERVKAGEACVVRNPLPIQFEGQTAPMTSFQAGNTISVAGRDIPIAATLDGYDGYVGLGSSGFTNGVQLIVSNQLYRELTGKIEYNELLPILKEHADRDAFDKVISGICANIPGSTYLSYEEADRLLAESYEQIRLLAWCLILFIGLIGILNIINTMYTSIHTRIKEIGVQRAIGMSAGSLYRTFLWEGAYYGVFAAVVGSIVGYLCTVLIGAAASGAIQLVPPPVVPIVEASLLSVAACLITTCVPLKKIARMAIVDSIESIE